jgi:peptidoglycan hydrolase-like protein with peptidoglycan-binding domain
MDRVLVALIAMFTLGATACDAQTATVKPASATTSAHPPVTAAKLPLYTRAQMKLRDLGQYTGAVNGRRDDATVAAIKKFQSNNHLPVSGRLTPETVKALGV